MVIPRHVIHGHPILEPQRVLQGRIRLKNGKEVKQGLIQWTGS